MDNENVTRFLINSFPKEDVSCLHSTFVKKLLFLGCSLQAVFPYLILVQRNFLFLKYKSNFDPLLVISL